MRLIYHKKGKGKKGEFGAAILLFLFFVGSYAVGASFTEEEISDGEYASTTGRPVTNGETGETESFSDSNTSSEEEEEEEETANCSSAGSGTTVYDPAECAPGNPVWQCEAAGSDGNFASTGDNVYTDYDEDFPFDRKIEVADGTSGDVTLNVTISSPTYIDTIGTVRPKTLIAYDEVEYEDSNEDGIPEVEYQYKVDNGNRTLVNTVTYDSEGNPENADDIQLENWNEAWGAAEIVYWRVTYENTDPTNYYRANPYDTSYISQISTAPSEVNLPVSMDAMVELYSRNIGDAYADIGGLWFAELALTLEASADDFDENEEVEYDPDAVPEVDPTTASIIQTAIAGFNGGTALYNTYRSNEDFLRQFEGDVAELMYIVPPGESRSYLLATYIPISGTQDVRGIGVELDNTLNREDIFVDGKSTNPVVATSTYNPNALGCNPVDNIPYAGLSSGPAYAAALRSSYGGLQLARAPLQGPLIVVRGFGCSSVFTGIRSVNCGGDTPWFHNGIDLVAPLGTDYYDALPNGGEVIYAGRWRSPYPNCSILISSAFPHEGLGYYVKHWGVINGIPVTVWGGHLSGFNVQTAQDVYPGQVLGETGTSGCSSGPHLHFAVEVNGLFIDPAFLLPS